MLIENVFIIVSAFDNCSISDDDDNVDDDNNDEDDDEDDDDKRKTFSYVPLLIVIVREGKETK